MLGNRFNLICLRTMSRVRSPLSCLKHAKQPWTIKTVGFAVEVATNLCAHNAFTAFLPMQFHKPMEKQPNTTERERSLNEMLIEAALNYLKMGFRPIRLCEGTKAAELKWKEYQSRPPTEEEVRAMFATGKPNIGLVTGGGVVVVDVDDPALLDAVIEHCGSTPMQTITPRGGRHLWYRMRAGVHYGNAVRINDRAIDLRCEGAYAVAPWSQTADGAYKWVGDILPTTELPLVRIGWLRERKPKRTLTPIEVSDELDVMVRRARGFIAHIEGSVSGQGGHRTAMRVAGVLCQKFGLDFDQAFPLFKEWSETTCEPPWSDAEITHKLKEAIRLRFTKGLAKID
jgi:Bifunctional DNA primase/polymerase, N-terminal